MSLAADIRAGGAFVELTLKDNAFVRGLRANQERLNAAGNVMTGIGTKIAAGAGVAAAGVGGMIAHFASVGDQLDKMAARTGFSVESLSSLKYAFGQSGASAEDLEKSIKTMQRTLLDAEQGSQGAHDKLNLLGLKFEDLKDKSPEEQFRTIAYRLGDIQDPSRRAAIAMELFGKSGANLLPLLNTGAKGVKALEDRAKEMGLVMTTEQATAAVVFGDLWADVWTMIGRASEIIASALVPALNFALDIVTKYSGRLMEFLEANKQTIAIIAAVIAGVLMFGTALIAAGFVLQGLAAVVGFVAAGIGMIGSAIGIAAGFVATLFTPLGALIALLATFGAAALFYSGAAGSAFTWLSEQAQAIFGSVSQVLSDVADAFMAGDIETAVKLLWSGVKLIWMEATGGLMNQLTGWWNFFRLAWAEGWFNLVEIVTQVGFLIQKTWADITKGVSDTWNSMTGTLAEGLIRATATVQGLSAEETQAIVDESNSITAQNKSEAQRQYDQRVAQLQSGRAEILAGVNAQRSDAQDKYSNDEQDRLAEQKAEVAKLRAEYKALQTAKDSPFVGPVRPAEASGPSLPQLASFDLLSNLAAGGGTAATFRASEVGGLAAGSPLSAIKKATEDTAANTQKIANKPEAAFS